MTSTNACPHCGTAVRPGATKCRSCRRWFEDPPARPPKLRALFGVSLGLLALGAGLGVTVSRARSAPLSPLLDRLLAHAPASASAPATPSTATATATATAATSAAAASPSASAAPAPASATAASPTAAPAATPGASPADAGWSEPRVAPLSASPLDVALSEDGATVLVLGADSVLRAVSADAAREDRRLPLPGQPRRLRMLGARYLAALDAKGVLPVVDLQTWTVARLDVGGAASDALALGEGRVLIAASAEARRVTRFVSQADAGAAPRWRASGDIHLRQPPVSLAVTSDDQELLALLEQGTSPESPGVVELLDPRVEPFGASSLVFSGVMGPSASLVAAPARGSAGAGSAAGAGTGAGSAAGAGDAGDAGGASGASRESVAALDRGGAQLLRITPGGLEITPLGAAPRQNALGGYRLGDRHLVVIDRAGAALVLAAADGAAVATLALGAPPADAALTPDGRALLISLGGEETALVSGDPPAITARLRTGSGSRAVSIAASGRRAAVAAYLGRSVAILDRR